AVAGYFMGRSRAVATVGGRVQNLHSLPSYHGLYVALWCGIPSLLIFVLWLVLQPHVIEAIVVSEIPGAAELPANRLGLLINDVRNLAAGLTPFEAASPETRAAAERLNALRFTGQLALAGVVLAIATLGLIWARQRIAPPLRARNRVEKAIMAILIV